MTKTRFLSLVTALALLLAIPSAVFAQQNARAHVFVGTATLDGATAADGATVTAWVGGEQVAATTVRNGDYDMLVTSRDGFVGETVSFKVSGANAAETIVWVEGGGDIMNLTATSRSWESGGSTGSTGVSGPAGPAGPAGAAGPRGVSGPTGPAGAAGSDGAAGPAGVAGVAGPTGGGGGAVRIIALVVAIAYGLIFLVVGGTYVMRRQA